MTECFLLAKQTVKNLTSYRPNVLTTSKRVAFTLAEVLITLGIIGVVAALTMPSLIENHQKKETVARLKSAYSILEQAILLSENDNGLVSEWDFAIDEAEFFDKYILSYMTSVNKKAVLSPTKPYPVKTIDGNACRSGSLKVLNNGVGFLPLKGADYFWIYIDINGTKEPNRLGRDVFVAELYRNKKLTMAKQGSSSGENYRNYLINETNYGCKKALSSIAYYAGLNCGALIMYDGWKISDDYPW